MPSPHDKCAACGHERSKHGYMDNVFGALPWCTGTWCPCHGFVEPEECAHPSTHVPRGGTEPVRYLCFEIIEPVCDLCFEITEPKQATDE